MKTTRPTNRQPVRIDTSLPSNMNNPRVKVLLLSLCLLNPAAGCSFTYFLKGEATICADSDCTTDPITSIILQLGQTICFTTADGTQPTQITLEESRIYTFYKQLYYACNYKLKTKIHTRCWQAGSNCNYKQCVPSLLTDNGYPQSSNKTRFTHYTGCTKQGTCTGYCGWEGYDRCLWGLAEVEEQTCYPILGLETVHWGIVVSIKENGYTMKYKVTDTSPFIYDKIEFMVLYNSMIEHRYGQETLLLIEKDVGIPVYASPLDTTIPHTIGVYQKSNDLKTVKFPLESLITCRSTGCSMKCVIPDSPILTTTSIRDWRLRKEYLSLSPTLSQARQYITSYEKPNTVIQLVTNKKGLDHLQLELASCQFEIISVIACSGCTTETSIIVSPKNMTKSGIMYMKSNCTFSPSYMRCQDEPYQMTLVHESPICEILTYPTRMKTGNFTQRIILTITYEFVGVLSPITYLTSVSDIPDNWESASLVLTNPSFIHGLGLSFGITALAILSLRLLAYVIAVKSGKEITC